MATILIAIPVLARPQNVAGLVENIATVTSVPHRVLFVCTEGDEAEIAAIRAAGAEALVEDFPARGQYAKKINTAFAAGDEPWIFTGADDLCFYPHWDTQALKVAARSGAGVVGTQDKGNPLVKKGLQSTHSLVSRAYVQEFNGATYDQTGEIYSELYDHQYVDLELVETAKLRGRWAFAKRSVVEHRHPAWKTARKDDTYVKAWRESKGDNRLFQQRMNRLRTVTARHKRRATL